MNRRSLASIVAPMVAAISNLNAKPQDAEDRVNQETNRDRKTLRGQLARATFAATMLPRGDMRHWWSNVPGRRGNGRRGRSFGKRRPGGRR